MIPSPFLGEDVMIMDIFFETREEARKTNDPYERYWKYMGTAKHEKGYVAWRTNSKKDLEKLFKCKDYFDILVDKPIEMSRYVLKGVSTEELVKEYESLQKKIDEISARLRV